MPNEKYRKYARCFDEKVPLYLIATKAKPKQIEMK
jgi:hypothetical protein